MCPAMATGHGALHCGRRVWCGDDAGPLLEEVEALPLIVVLEDRAEGRLVIVAVDLDNPLAPITCVVVLEGNRPRPLVPWDTEDRLSTEVLRPGEV